MKGNTAEKRKSGTRFIVRLAAAHVVAATFTLFVVAQAAPAAHMLVSPKAAALALAVAAAAGAVIDFHAASHRQWTLGARRQTPKHLLSMGEHAWVTPYVWGADTGLLVTTYRVSFCSWLLLLAALLGIGPAWIGLVYGLAFAVPLVLAARLGKTRFHHPAGGARPWSAAPVQVGGIAAMLVLALTSLQLAVAR